MFDDTVYEQKAEPGLEPRQMEQQRLDAVSLSYSVSLQHYSSSPSESPQVSILLCMWDTFPREIMGSTAFLLFSPIITQRKGTLSHLYSRGKVGIILHCFKMSLSYLLFIFSHIMIGTRGNTSDFY